MTTLEQLTKRVHARRELPPPELRRALRKAAGASLADLGDVIGVTYQAVQHWETGARTPKGSNLESYVEVLRELRRAVAEQPHDGALIP